MTLISTVIPHIPPRAELLRVAVASVESQTHPEKEIIVITDTEHRGSSWSVAEGVRRSKGEWITLCADDDWLLPEHHAHLLACQLETGADVVYPWYNMIGSRDWQEHLFGQPFDEAMMRDHSWLPGGGSLIRGELLRGVGIPQPEEWPAGCQYDDWAMYLRLLDAGAKFHHLAERLYCWRIWGGNVSGRGDRW